MIVPRETMQIIDFELYANKLILKRLKELFPCTQGRDFYYDYYRGYYCFKHQPLGETLSECYLYLYKDKE